MPIPLHEVHIWSADLTISAQDEAAGLALLSPQEVERANRFQFPIHRKRFIAAHCAWRVILSRYLNIEPKAISFAYTQHNKPYLPEQPLQINMSHSEDIAVYALSLQGMLGIDIEEIKPTYNPDLIQRYFSPHEVIALEKLHEAHKAQGFYNLWSRKEALIKAVGKGLAIPLDSFSVAPLNVIESIELEHEHWSLFPLGIHTGFAAAVACNVPVKTLCYCKYLN